MKKNASESSTPSSNSKSVTLSPDQADALHHHFICMEKHFKDMASILDEAELDSARRHDIRALIDRLRQSQPPIESGPVQQPTIRTIQFDSIEALAEYLRGRNA